ncbi:MAG TPA: nucleotidyltransferase family protein [Pyrinomonadaceae bacterium]|nr:nucleotidyltransferase family protein [Pyrinomonadaceae bacterium]
MTQDLSSKTEHQRPGANDVSAIILAAGRSSRMGAFKPLLPFGLKSVIQTCIDNMRSGGVQGVVVVGPEGPRSAELKTHLREFNITLAINPDPDSEMSASIACGVLAVPETTKAIVIIPVDHAAVPGEVVSALIRTWKEGALLVKPTIAGRGGHPVLIDRAFRDDLLSLNPERGLKGFFTEHQDQARRLEVNSNYIARDMDTWDDYRTLHQEIFGFPPPPG